MPSHCPKCGLNFYREPGFYYGAMFFGYVITSGLFLVIGLVMTFGLGMDVNTALIVIVILGVLLFIYFFRLARSLWIHMVEKYDPDVLNSETC